MPVPLSRLEASALPLIRYSLVLLWLGSGLVSLFNDAAGRALLFALPRPLADTLILGGAAVDLSLGFALMVARWTRIVALFQIAVILLYTALATALIPELWLDPLMPLGKNLPILAMTLLLAQASRR